MLDLPDKIVYLMRGLPCCGKSHRAKRLAGNTGAIFETDEYFYTQVPGDPTRFKYNHALLPKARAWNFARYSEAIHKGISPIIVDRGNSLNEQSYQYAQLAHQQGYTIILIEPDSVWWQEIRVLLKYKPHTMIPLAKWAEKLAEMSRNTPPHHGVQAEYIYHLMQHWRSDVTVEKILALGSIKNI